MLYFLLIFRGTMCWFSVCLKLKWFLPFSKNICSSLYDKVFLLTVTVWCAVIFSFLYSVFLVLCWQTPSILKLTWFSWSHLRATFCKEHFSYCFLIVWHRAANRWSHTTLYYRFPKKVFKGHQVTLLQGNQYFKENTLLNIKRSDCSLLETVIL